jgi:hypothetical protein
MIVSKAVFALMLNPSLKKDLWPEPKAVSESVEAQSI